MSFSTIDGDCRVNGTLTAQRVFLPPGTVTDDAVIASAGIQANKVVHQTAHHYEQDPGAAVVSQTRLIHTVYGATATAIAMDVMTPSPPTGTDTVTVDLQKGNPTTGFATILAAPVTLNSSTVARQPVEASITSPNLLDDDTLQIVVTATAGSGAQAQGLLVTVTLQEAPQ